MHLCLQSSERFFGNVWGDWDCVEEKAELEKLEE